MATTDGEPVVGLERWTSSIDVVVRDDTSHARGFAIDELDERGAKRDRCDHMSAVGGGASERRLAVAQQSQGRKHIDR